MRRQVDEICLAFFCERCGAAPGIWCSSRTGLAAAYLHVSRFTQAVDAGQLPIKDA